MKLGILGSNGRMGQMIAAEIASGQHDVQLGGAADRNDHKDIVFKNCDVVIDFSASDATNEHISLARQYKKPLVIGTTGLDAGAEAALLSAAKEIPVFRAANMSLGVNLLLSLVEQAAAKLGSDFDIEIFESHHRHKVDAPSGTALALGHAAARGRGVDLKEVTSIDRTGKRKPGDIGFSVFRGGDVVGEHTVTFAGMGERLELTHKASDRAIFAAGAIKAAVWLKNQPTGLYSMRDMLKI